MLTTTLLALAIGETLSSPCRGRCPCVVPAGVDWHSAAVMAPLARRDAYAVFRGQVARADTIAQDTLDLAPQTSQWPQRIIRPTFIRYTFTVERTWKGPWKHELIVTNYGVDTSWGRDYVPGLIYVVYADRDSHAVGGQTLSTYSCSRVRAGEEAEDDIKVLGAGRPPRN